MRKKKGTQGLKKFFTKKIKKDKNKKKRKNHTKKEQERIEKDKQVLSIIVLFLIIFNIFSFSIIKPNITGIVIQENFVTSNETQKSAQDPPEVENTPPPNSSPEPTPNSIPETTPTPDPVPAPEPMPDTEPEPVKTENITIASWNLVSFNQTKSSNSSIFNVIEEIVKQFDITFLQEISEDDSFSLLCDELSQYKCESSSFSGKNSSKGKYGLIYNEDFKLDDFNDRNVNSNSNWERPPIKAEFEFGEENIYLYNFRSRPEEAQEELEFLETLIEDVEDVEEDIIIVLGDLAADCDYYDYDSESEFKADWTWIIKNDEDTTSTSEDCAYDRIIMSDEAEKEYINSGIYKTNITENVSDHYLIWVEIEVESD